MKNQPLCIIDTKFVTPELVFGGQDLPLHSFSMTQDHTSVATVPRSNIKEDESLITEEERKNTDLNFMMTPKLSHKLRNNADQSRQKRMKVDNSEKDYGIMSTARSINAVDSDIKGVNMRLTYSPIFLSADRMKKFYQRIFSSSIGKKANKELKHDIDQAENSTAVDDRCKLNYDFASCSRGMEDKIDIEKSPSRVMNQNYRIAVFLLTLSLFGMIALVLRLACQTNSLKESYAS